MTNKNLFFGVGLVPFGVNSEIGACLFIPKSSSRYIYTPNGIGWYAFATLADAQEVAQIAQAAKEIKPEPHAASFAFAATLTEIESVANETNNLSTQSAQ